MSERNGSRLTIPWALAISIGVSVLTAGIAWGVLETRVATVERDVETVSRDHRETAAVVRGHDRQLVEVRTQYSEIIRRLDRIERRLERQ